MLNNKDKKKKILIIGLIIIIILLMISGLLLIFSPAFNSQNGKSTLFLETDTTLTAMSQEEFYIDIKLSDFPQEVSYPASSFVLNFDNSKLEFKELRLGTIGVCNEKGENLNVPMWECNADISNKNGTISAMYIDMTASDSSYRSNGFEKDVRDVLVRVQFELKDSAIKGDELKFSFSDAVLASVDKTDSLAMVDNTLNVKDYFMNVE